MATRNISDMREDLKGFYMVFQRNMRDSGLDFILTNVARADIEQKALHAQGREPLEVVNALRIRAGLPPITAAENKRKVTWTLKSKHVTDDNNPKARAFDIVIMSGGKPLWDVNADTNSNHSSDYAEAGKIWESISPKCKWGGRFGDQPHFEVL